MTPRPFLTHAISEPSGMAAGPKAKLASLWRCRASILRHSIDSTHQNFRDQKMPNTLRRSCFGCPFSRFKLGDSESIAAEALVLLTKVLSCEHAAAQVTRRTPSPTVGVWNELRASNDRPCASEIQSGSALCGNQWMQRQETRLHKLKSIFFWSSLAAMNNFTCLGSPYQSRRPSNGGEASSNKASKPLVRIAVFRDGYAIQLLARWYSAPHRWLDETCSAATADSS